MLEKHNVGSPAKYNIESILEVARQYLDDCRTGKEDFPRTLQIPIRCKMSKDRFYDYVKMNKELSDILKEIKIMSEDVLVHKGLTEGYNPPFVKFLLSAKHGYKEKTAVESTSTNKNINQNFDYSSLTDEQLTKIDAILNETGGNTGTPEEENAEELL